ncbi:MAG: c-type cytochrome biogenesis protein CcmI [Betaproteobacteria bacterium]
MIGFVAVALAMVAIAIAWVMIPLLRRHHSSGVLSDASNVAVLRDQRQELDADLARGTISSEQHALAQRELEQRVIAESAPSDEASRLPSAQPGRATAYALGGALPIAAIALYALWGNPAAFSPVAQNAPPQHAVSAADVEQMVAKLAARLEREPDNAEGWVVLARSYHAMNRYGDATRAFEHAVRLVPDDPNVLTDYADALGATQNSLQGKPTELIARALAIDRKNPKALALAGTAAFDRKDFVQAVAYWEALKAVVPADTPMAKSVDASIAEARALGALATVSANAGAVAGTPSVQVAPAASAVAPISRIEGTVKLSDAVAAKASPSDTVFIFARAAEGSRMPLAIVRKEVRDLPARFSLDDSMAMAPGMTLSSATAIVVGARVSKSGTAMPRSGDLEGLSAPVKAGATGLSVVIDRALP